MVTALLDTAVVVDLLRGFPPAIAWLSQYQGQLGLSPIVWLEIIEGASDRYNEQTAVSLLRRFERVELAPQDADWAIRQLLHFHLSHGLDAMDCLIAAVNFRLGIPLYTHNLKHFMPLLGPLTQKPY